MKIISTKEHGALDYVVGALLIAAPWVFGFYKGGIESYVPIAMGSLTLLYSLCTDYELGVFKLLTVRTHLMLDLLSGLTLAASPWLFHFDEVVYLPHLLVGIVEIVVVVLSERVPYYNENPTVKL